MKKFVLSLAALALISASSLTASAQTSASATVGSAQPSTLGGCNPRPQGILGSIYAAVTSFFSF